MCRLPPETGLRVARTPAARRSNLAPATLASMSAPVHERAASIPALVTLQPVPPMFMPVQLLPVTPAPVALE